MHRQCPPNRILDNRIVFAVIIPGPKPVLQAWRIFLSSRECNTQANTSVHHWPKHRVLWPSQTRWEFLDNVHPKSHVIPWTQPLKKNRHLSTHVHLPVFSILTCGLCQDAVSPTWPEAEVVTQSGHLYWFHCHVSRETWIQKVCKIETNSAQPRSSRRNVNPLLERQDRFWMRNVRQCLGPWTCVS